MKRDTEYGLGRGDGNVADTGYSSCFEEVVSLEEVGVEDDVVGLQERQRMPNSS